MNYLEIQNRNTEFSGYFKNSQEIDIFSRISSDRIDKFVTWNNTRVIRRDVGFLEITG